MNTREDPVNTRGDQAITREDPVNTRGDQAITRKDPVNTREDPVTIREDPVIIREDPATTREDPARISVIPRDNTRRHMVREIRLITQANLIPRTSRSIKFTACLSI